MLFQLQLVEGEVVEEALAGSHDEEARGRRGGGYFSLITGVEWTVDENAVGRLRSKHVLVGVFCPPC